MDIPQPKNLVQRFRHLAQKNAGKILYTFLEDGEDQEVTLSYGQLDQQARALAAHLQSLNLQGERALLIYPPGLDFIVGMFACLYSGVIAVPAYPPDPNRLEKTLPRLQSIVKDSGAKVLLTTKQIKSASAFITHQAPEFSRLQWIASDKIDPSKVEAWQEPSYQIEELAFLQYTSGSTGDPKGVMISHGNLTHNIKVIHQGFDLKEGEDRAVFWLPPYHDMGLIGGILAPAVTENPVTLFSPLHFIQKPFRWLRAISKNKAAISGGPNFAFEMCLRKVTPEQKKCLNLSSWTLAFTGAEHIHPETLRKFQDAFSVCGFAGSSFLPCYGLAESTLMVTGYPRGTGFRTLPVPKDKLLGGDSRKDHSSEFIEFISCGKSPKGLQVVIANPESLSECGEGEVGEILVSGSSVAQGYWGNKTKTKNYFGIKLSNNGQEGFCRTGDLGFIQGGELYVTGRLKDLIIIRGQNHYPTDIERSVQACHVSFRPGGTAAFSILEDHEEKLVVVQEIDPTKLPKKPKDLGTLLKEVRRAVFDKHELDLFRLLLVEKGILPKTSSGKLQRFACRNAFLSGDLQVLESLGAEAEPEKTVNGKSPSTPLGVHPDFQAILDWLTQRLSEVLEISVKEIDPTQPLTDYGLDSKDAVNISGDLEDQIGRPLSPTLLWKYPTLEGLAKFLAHEDQDSEEAE